MEKEEIQILYTNWKNETARRRIRPIQIWFGATDWHPEEQWFLRAFDLEKSEERNFATKDIKQWSIP